MAVDDADDSTAIEVGRCHWMPFFRHLSMDFARELMVPPSSGGAIQISAPLVTLEIDTMAVMCNVAILCPSKEPSCYGRFFPWSNTLEGHRLGENVS